MILKGIFPPMITPFTENGEVDYKAFQANTEKWIESGLSGLVVLGSNSETVLLNSEEKIKLIDITVKHAQGKPVICGTGVETTTETIELTNKAADLGVDAALVLTPHFYGSDMNTSALMKYYTEIADKSRIPILVYNVSKFTHVNVGADLIEKLADHPNIIGMKDSNGDMIQLANFIRVTKGKDFSVFVGTASALFPALCLGASGGVLALANCNPKECVEVYDSFVRGDIEKARDIYYKMMPVNAAVTAKYSIAGLKYACSLQGFDGGFVRNPLQELSEDGRKIIEKLLTSIGLLQ